MEYPEVVEITHVLGKGFLHERILLGFPVTCTLTPVISSNKPEDSKLQVNNPSVKCIWNKYLNKQVGHFFSRSARNKNLLWKGSI